MDQYHFLHVRIPGRGRLTLSLPGGIARAFLAGRLPETAEAWDDAKVAWVPWRDHPAVAALLAWGAVPRTVEYPILANPASDLDAR